MSRCDLCPNCIWEPQSNCNVYRNMLKYMAEEDYAS